MAEEKSSTSSAPENGQIPRNRSLRAFRLRIAIFLLIVIACVWYSGFLQSMWTHYSPRTCATGDVGLFRVDFNEVPARLGDQFNACANVGDGSCRRIAGQLMIQGECRNGRMHGNWSVNDATMTNTSWTGRFCDGLPCGEFQVSVTNEHDPKPQIFKQMFHIENLHVHGPTTLWQFEKNKIIQWAGEYKFGKRTGRWVRYAEPAHTLLSVIIYDESGFPATTTYSCTNGNRKEVRGKSIFYYDAGGNILPNENGTDEKALDARHCPLP